MGKIIAVANQKGGVGKTTTCVNLTCALKKRGRRVLLVDCDPQGNSTSGMGVDKTATPNCYDMLMNGAAAADCIRSTKYGDVLPANMNLSGCSVELVSSEQREYIMKTALAAVQDDYDFILIDYLSKADEKPAAAEHAAEPAAKKPARKTKKTTRSTKKPAAEAAPSAEPEPTPEPEPEPEPKKPNIGEIHNLLHIASEKYQDADGFVNVSSSGLYIKRVKPDFNVRAYGYSKLPELLAAFPNKYQIKRYEGKGGATIIAYKCL